MLVPMEASTAPRHVLGRAAPVADGSATQRSWTPMMLETLCASKLSPAKQAPSVATSAAILCFALQARVQESYGRIS